MLPRWRGHTFQKPEITTRDLQLSLSAEWRHQIPMQIMKRCWSKQWQRWANTPVTIDYRLLWVPRAQSNTMSNRAPANMDPWLHKGDVLLLRDSHTHTRTHTHTNLCGFFLCVCVLVGGWTTFLWKGVLSVTHVWWTDWAPAGLRKCPTQILSFTDLMIHTCTHTHTHTHTHTVFTCYFAC